MDKVMFAKPEKMDYGTPQKFFDGLHEIFNFTIDICAHEGNHKLPRYYMESDNALEQDWSFERVWCNPPYGRNLPIWVEKILSEKSDLIVALLPLSAKTHWFQSIRGSGYIMCMIKGALKFDGAKYQAPFTSVLLIWGEVTEKQLKYLNSLGLVVSEK